MTARIIVGDCREVLRAMDAESVNCVVTSPPYFGLRDYGVDGQIGLEETLHEYVETLVSVFREVRRVLRSDGTCWLNIGDSYVSSPRGNKMPGGGGLTNSNIGSPVEDARFHAARSRRPPPHGLKPKDLMMVPARVALALQADGWWVRDRGVWYKRNPMPESVKDRPTQAHEDVYLLTKAARYWYDHEAVKTPARRESIERLGRARMCHVERPPGSAPHGGILADRPHKSDKQRGHGRRHDGFNDRWDAMSKEEQQANGANMRNVYDVATQPYSGAHFATFPPKLIEPFVKAGCPEGGVVLDPFGGAGTVGLVAERLGRDSLLIELNPEYAEMARNRIADDAPLFADVELTGA